MCRCKKIDDNRRWICPRCPDIITISTSRIISHSPTINKFPLTFISTVVIKFIPQSQCESFTSWLKLTDIWRSYCYRREKYSKAIKLKSVKILNRYQIMANLYKCIDTKNWRNRSVLDCQNKGTIFYFFVSNTEFSLRAVKTVGLRCSALRADSMYFQISNKLLLLQQLKLFNHRSKAIANSLLLLVWFAVKWTGVI